MKKEAVKKPVKSRIIGQLRDRLRTRKFVQESVLVEQGLMSYHEYESRWYRPRTF